MFILVYLTAGNEQEAKKIAETLVTEKLVACVNYFPINSVYEWKNKLEKTTEFVLICKTKKEKFKSLEKRVRKIHSYENPAIVALDIVDGSKIFLDWINDQTK